MAKNSEIPENYFGGDNVLITGSTSGIGRKAAEFVANRGGNVYIHGRKESGEDIADQLSRSHGVKSEFLRADLSDMNEVRSIAPRLKEHVDTLDYLVNNAGVFMRGEATALSEFQYTFVVNHLSHFVLTSNLLPLLMNSENPRVVNTASEAHSVVSSMEIPDSFAQSENGWNAYCRSKTANIMFTYSLRRRYDDTDLDAVSLHPGAIPGSGFFRNLPGPIDKISGILNRIPLPGIETTDKGGQMIVYCMAVDPDLGPYFSDFENQQPSALAQNEHKQEKLWSFSEEIGGIEEFHSVEL